MQTRTEKADNHLSGKGASKQPAQKFQKKFGGKYVLKRE